MNAIELRDFRFSFDAAQPDLFSRMNLEIPAGARVLVVGANGVGKTSLLSILAGIHLVPRESVRVLGGSPFHDLENSNQVAWVGGEFKLNLDLAVDELIQPSQERDAELLSLFGVSRGWRMHRVSEGQRRRVQLFLALRRLRDPRSVLLLDEVTAHLDVTMRSDFLAWLTRESKRGVTVMYATHIFDGLVMADQLWPTHLLWLGFDRKYHFVSDVDRLVAKENLGQLCEKWIRTNNHRS